MIQRLRRRHRQCFALLLGVLPAAVVAAVAFRQPAVEMSALPAALLANPELAGAESSPPQPLFPNTPLRVGWVRPGAGGRAWGIRLDPDPQWLKPDVLVYWVPEPTAVSDRVPEVAQLLGNVRARATLPLPLEALGRPGRLLLYSLAYQEVLDRSQPLELRETHR